MPENVLMADCTNMCLNLYTVAMELKTLESKG